MRLIRLLRYSVGFRLLAGFWATLIVALISVWLLSRWTANELDFRSPNASENQRLSVAATKLRRAYANGIPLRRLARPLPRMRRTALLIYDVEEEVVIGEGPSKFPRVQADIERLSQQPGALLLTRPAYRLLGPEPVTLNGRPYQIFLHQMTPENRQNLPRIALVLAALFGLSVVFSLVFSRALLRPIRALQQAAQQLAQGNWDARVDPQFIGKDELGELALVFNKMAQSLADNWNGQKRLLADVSHELRSPLARLNMAIGLAEHNSQDPETVTKSLQRIENEAIKMDKLIGDVLMLSRAEAVIVEKASIPLSDVLDSVIHNAEFEASQQGKSFTPSPIPDGVVVAHQDSLQSALENIVRNAIRHAASQVWLTATYDAANTQSGNLLTLTVRDDGPGIPDGQREAIFMPFYRGDQVRSQFADGVGLGLAIAKAAVTAHHGSISAENAPDGGLAVTITMNFTPQ